MINPVKYFHTALNMTQIATADDISVLDVICCSLIGTSMYYPLKIGNLHMLTYCFIYIICEYYDTYYEYLL